MFVGRDKLVRGNNSFVGRDKLVRGNIRLAKYLKYAYDYWFIKLSSRFSVEALFLNHMNALLRIFSLPCETF